MIVKLSHYPILQLKMAIQLQIIVSRQYYLKDPQSTDLGEGIVRNGILLFDQLGFEDFTFKKLAEEIGSTEASIYRYFDNKRRFLLYITAMYWRWLDYLVDYNTHHIENSENRLRTTLQIICDPNKFGNDQVKIFDSEALKRVVMAESDKTYLTKDVDEINKEGLFRAYKDFCQKVACMIKVINPDYPYAHSLVSTALEASNQQVFFAMHLPSLTELKEDGSNPGDLREQVFKFIEHTVFKLILPNGTSK